MQNNQSSRSGNIFFTLFGAVALVGVVGASTMTIMKGPVKSMAEVTKRTVAENNMIAAGRLSIVAVKQQSNEDCDTDSFVEPLPWDGPVGAAPAGGGNLPASVGASRTDPWGTTFGYCAWDHGTVIDAGACGGASQKRLRGANVENKAVIAVISAGPDRVFQTTCGDSNAAKPYVGRVTGSDDMVLEYTYADSQGMAGGLWNVKQGDLKTAEIDKNLEIKNAANKVLMAFDQTSDTNKPSLKVDFISKLSAAKKGVEYLSNIMLGTSWLSGDGDNEGIRIDGAGNVGIGTAPVSTSKLNILGPDSGPTYGALRIETNGVDQVMLIDGNEINTIGASTPGLFLQHESPHDIYMVEGGGKVGIGTAAPNANVLLDVAGGITAGREGYSGTYNSAQVQGVWSMGPQYKIDIANNTFGNLYGTVYGYNTSSTGAANTPMSNWGHQLLNVSNGSVTSGVSLSYGHGYFAGNIGIGTKSPANALEIHKPVPVVVLRDTDNTVAQPAALGYMTFTDKNGALMGWVGDDHSLETGIWLGDARTNGAVILSANGTDNLKANANGSVQIPGFINDTGAAAAGLKFISGGYVTINSPSSAYDVWIQGGASTAGGTARNLALLGATASDILYVNHSSEYAGGTVIGGPVTINGSLNVTGGYSGQGDDLGDGGTTTGALYSQNASGYGYLGLNGSNYARFSNGAIYIYQGGAWTYYFTPSLFAPYVTAVSDLGTSSKRWRHGWFSGTVTANNFVGDGSGLSGVPGDNLGNHTATTNLNMANRAIVSDAGTLRDANGGWVRTYNSTGWYNATYGGGMYMLDTNYVRTYNNKGLYASTAGLVGVTGDSTGSYGVVGYSDATYGIMGRSNAANRGGVIGYTQDSSVYGIVGYNNAYSLYGNGDVYISGNSRAASFTGSGAALTALNASQLTAGTIPNGRLSGNYSGIGTITATTFSGAHSGNGSGLTTLNASNLASGTVPVARIGTGTKNTTTFYRGDGTFSNALGGNLSVTGTVTAATPTAAGHLATKAYVDAKTGTPDTCWVASTGHVPIGWSQDMGCSASCGPGDCGSVYGYNQTQSCVAAGSYGAKITTVNGSVCGRSCGGCGGS